jgi:cyclopropane fatty-acyl-phospholipid synthase-like methyltransferase
MNDQVQNTQAEPVLVDEQLPEFLKQAAEKLEKDGEVLLQTEEDVGTEQRVTLPATVH